MVIARARATCSSVVLRVCILAANSRAWFIVLSEHGPIKMSTYLTIYRVGDIVDIKANAAQQKGMPHKYYHGYDLFERLNCLAHHGLCRRTGIIYNVTPGAVGVIVHKIVGNRYIEKRVNIRIEHIKHSKCRQEFLDRVKSNTEAHSAARDKGGECGI